MDKLLQKVCKEHSSLGKTDSRFLISNDDSKENKYVYGRMPVTIVAK